MSIQEHLNKIRNAIYGREVRESIAKGIETAYDDASEKHDNANMEVKIARGTNPNLNTRLNKMDETDRQNAEKIDSNYNEVTAQLALTEYEKADVAYVDQIVARMSGGAIKGTFPTLSALEEAYPNGEVGPFLVEENKNRYIWDVNKSVWVSIGVYEPAEIEKNSVGTEQLVNGGVTNNKITLPIDGLTTKTFVFALEDGVLAKNRAIANNIHLDKGSVIETNSIVEFSLWKENENGEKVAITNPGWHKSFVVPKTDIYILRARLSNDQEISDSDLDYIGNNLYITTSNTAITEKKKEYYIAPGLTFEYGGLVGNGELDSSQTGLRTRVRTNNYFKVDAGTIIRLKNPENTRYAVDVEGESNFMRVDGQIWVKRDVQIQEDLNIRIMQSFDDNRLVDGETLFFKNNIEIIRPTDLVRASDLPYFVDSIEINYDNLVNYGLVQSKKDSEGVITQEIRDENVYPLTPVWGHEYLYSWYDKLRNDEPIKMVWAGDSTTYNSNLEEEFKRHSLGKKILTLGGYDETLVTSINAGHGAQHTGNWLDTFLEEDMAQNPDLYVFAYGFNDGSNSHFSNLSWDEKVSRFETNLNEGLERIRGSMYSKTPDDMPIILTTPIAGYDEGRGNTPQVWNDRIKPIIQKACREYKCAFVDVTARQYDHGFSSSWSTDGDFVHPNETANVDYMSMYADLIMPYLLRK